MKLKPTTYEIGELAKGNRGFPFLALSIENNSCIPNRNVFQILHKHEDIEFIYVEKNTLEIRTPMTTLRVEEGNGAFIGKNVLHILNTFNTCKCRAYVFSDDLLTLRNVENSRDQVSKYTEHPIMDALLLSRDEGMGDVLDELIALGDLSYRRQHENLIEYPIMMSLLGLWYHFIQSVNVTSYNIEAHRKLRGERLEGYLTFIQENYLHAISVTDIAASSYTSVSECNRTFKDILKTTAYEYLIRYRINRSLALLKDTDLTIAHIAQAVGYNSSSQFTKYFKKNMGMKPSEYRRITVSEY